jgi:EAL domain-containing protein (putative c-di-GMP-specific phosphodiesterase class I)
VTPNRVDTQTGLEACIAARAFTLAYQPIVHLDTGSVAGVEALCRFTDGASTEGRFQDAERLGLAAELDLAIIESVARQMPEIPDGYVSINLSPSTVSDERLGDALLGSGLPVERVVVEVTEHARIPDYERAEHILTSLRSAGVRLAVDDAGAGYATFRHILALRPDMIKMDRSITENIDADTARRALATALVIFGGEIGATVIAEGVETEAEIVALRRAGIHRAQGFALAPPAPLPLPAVLYEPLALANVLDLTGSEDVGSQNVAAHGLLAAVDAIGAVLDIVNERLAAIGEERYRGVVGTAQRQARHVGGALRDMTRGFPQGTNHVLDLNAATLGVGGGDRVDAIEQVRVAAETLRLAEGALTDAVVVARHAGATWEDMGHALGMTRQGASRRYRNLQIEPGAP